MEYNILSNILFFVLFFLFLVLFFVLCAFFTIKTWKMILKPDKQYFLPVSNKFKYLLYGVEIVFLLSLYFFPYDSKIVLCCGFLFFLLLGIRCLKNLYFSVNHYTENGSIFPVFVSAFATVICLGSDFFIIFLILK